MSNVNIKRAVENIRAGTSSYTPIVEVVVNAIQAIEAVGKEIDDGQVTITVRRSPQIETDGAAADIEGFLIRDNGVGFNEVNREAFDTLYTAHKLAEGGKGFGRFTCLKYYKDVKISSVYRKEPGYCQRKFRMGTETEIIVDEKVSRTEETQTGSVVELYPAKRSFPDKSLAAIARTLVEKLLPYFISKDKVCPRILLAEEDGSDSILLNDYLLSEQGSLIYEVSSAGGGFALPASQGEEEFHARVFKIYSPKTSRSKISLVAHRREVVSTSLHNYIPEFAEEFYDEITAGSGDERNFIVAVYVFGDYLDENVSIERGGFEFHRDNDLILGISQTEIEAAAAEYARAAVDTEVTERQARKVDRVKSYVKENAPWHAELLRDLDLSNVPYKPSNEEIEAFLHKQKYSREVKIKGEVRALLQSEGPEDLREKAAQLVSQISGSSKSELVHYVALRRSVLDLFERSLSLNADGTYSSEDVVHDIIFPTKTDSDATPFEDHNLWIVDERLNFAEYLTSDLPLDHGRSDRPDILAFDKRIGLRGANEPSNPVTVFEFKRPQRDDFVNPSSKEDPVQQIIRYVIQIKEGRYRTPRGREILVADNTPFYGYVICDLTPKVRRWVEDERDFKPMPDGMGYFNWHEKLNLYIEVLSWDKVLKDAVMRNRVFFHKLGIE
ncbi:ATP-binding protein [Halomonas denitrificans]|nr:ATP-binding protein [Halomonas denitrificans]